ncbi:hypothetical protein NA57DRAFT_59245 [Rhizodiscina lignyota]|uniref:DSBA-like thioredoxin domain-containing protein n=1 Tax=Rhizodiscina lignyota TaxID=1504668 RepID=A0A9P4IB79_9PEZI|nr:hypothetical protein NA57DRAFT_59245 [Rhizodiscina lignyota]
MYRYISLHWRRQPEEVPHGILQIQRALSACGEKYPNDFGPLLAALYESMWARGLYIYPEHEFEPILKNVLGASKSEEIISLSKTEETKNLLKKYTDEVFRDGACGVPWVVAERENGDTISVWGFDHLGVVLDFLVPDKKLPPML